MRKWILALLLSFTTPAVSNSYLDFSGFQEVAVVSLAAMHEGAELSQRNGFKFFQILSYGIHYQGKYHTYDVEEMEEEGINLLHEHGDNFIIIRGFYGPVNDHAVVDSYKYMLQYEQLSQGAKDLLTKNKIF